MDTKTYYVYRLFDPDYSTITRYVGVTSRPETRLAAHRSILSMSSGAFVCPWVVWLSGIGRKPEMETIERISVSSFSEAKAIEEQHILAYGNDNRWFLNTIPWKRDKTDHGIPRGVVNAYAHLANEWALKNGNPRHHVTEAMKDLERAHDRLKLFQYRYIEMDSPIRI